MVVFQSEAEPLPLLDFGTGLEPAYEHRIFEDVHAMLGGAGLVGRPFTIYKRSSNWFEVSIDATLNGRGQHMIYVTGLQYDVPNGTDPNTLGVEKELQRTSGIFAQLCNADDCTDPLTKVKKGEIATAFGLDLVESTGIIKLRDNVTRKKVRELLAQTAVV